MEEEEEEEEEEAGQRQAGQVGEKIIMFRNDYNNAVKWLVIKGLNDSSNK